MIKKGIILAGGKGTRIPEYTSKIPEVGINQFVDAGQSQFNRPASKISTYSHYTSKVLRLLKL